MGAMSYIVLYILFGNKGTRFSKNNVPITFQIQFGHERYVYDAAKIQINAVNAQNSLFNSTKLISVYPYS